LSIEGVVFSAFSRQRKKGIKIFPNITQEGKNEKLDISKVSRGAKEVGEGNVYICMHNRIRG
jgi:hypothetical protein